MNKKSKSCVLCQQDIVGYGNNASPLAAEQCCDKCNMRVIHERLKDLKSESKLQSGELDHVMVVDGEKQPRTKGEESANTLAMNVKWSLTNLKTLGWKEETIRANWLKDLKSITRRLTEDWDKDIITLIWNDLTETSIPMSRNNKYIGLPDDYSFPWFSSTMQKLMEEKEGKPCH